MILIFLLVIIIIFLIYYIILILKNKKIIEKLDNPKPIGQSSKLHTCYISDKCPSDSHSIYSGELRNDWGCGNGCEAQGYTNSTVNTTCSCACVDSKFCKNY